MAKNELKYYLVFKYHSIRVFLMCLEERVKACLHLQALEVRHRDVLLRQFLSAHLAATHVAVKVHGCLGSLTSTYHVISSMGGISLVM